MKDSNLVSSFIAADLMGISSAYLVKWFLWLDGFPRCVKTPSRAWLFPRKEVIRWARGHDIKAEFVAAKKRKYSERGRGFDCHRAVEFMTGKYLSAEKRNQLEFRKMTARTLKPKTYRMRVVSDWASVDDDERSAA